MDDLKQVAVLLAKPEPSGDVIGRGRDQLTEAIRTRARHHPARHRPGRPHPAGRRLARRASAGWLAVGATLTAAAAVAAVAASGLVTSGGKVPSSVGPPTGIRSRPEVAPTAATAQSPAQRILLAAAATALHQRPGTYWHFKIRDNPAGHVKPPPGVHVLNTEESWIAPDGKYWNAQPRCAAPPGTAVFEGPGYGGLSLGKLDVNYQMTRRLPTSPAALMAWIAKYNPHGVYGPAFVPDTLISLLWQVPAPPAVRAAAFKALAALPGVKSLGPVKGGVGLLITPRQVPADWIRLVVDPATSLVRSESNFKGVTIIHAGWTSRLPRIIPLPPKNACGT